MEIGAGAIGWTNTQSSTLNGHRCLTFEETQAGIKASGVAFIYKNKGYTLKYAYKGIKGSNDRKFFDSVKFN